MVSDAALLIHWELSSLALLAGLITSYYCLPLTRMRSHSTASDFPQKIRGVRPITVACLVVALVCVLEDVSYQEADDCQIPQVTSSVFWTIVVAHNLPRSHWTVNASETASWLSVLVLQAASVLPIFNICIAAIQHIYLAISLLISVALVPSCVICLWSRQHTSSRRLYDITGSITSGMNASNIRHLI